MATKRAQKLVNNLATKTEEGWQIELKDGFVVEAETKELLIEELVGFPVDSI